MIRYTVTITHPNQAVAEGVRRDEVQDVLQSFVRLTRHFDATHDERAQQQEDGNDLIHAHMTTKVAESQVKRVQTHICESRISTEGAGCIRVNIVFTQQNTVQI